jgi:periplasmic protein TonB
LIVNASVPNAQSAPLTHTQRNALIVAAVLVLHVLALWALQTGLLRRVVEVMVPVQVLSEFIEPPAPKVAPPPPAPPPVKQPVQPKPAALPPAPQPAAIADPTPAPNAPAGVTTPQPPLPPIAAPVAAAPAPAPPAPPAPPKVVLPSTDADYLQNPKPVYPPMSKRLNEQGKVLVRVLIGDDGKPQKAELRQSSGFDRLDSSAMNTVMQWRYVPGKRGGVPEAMWFVVPINFVLE